MVERAHVMSPHDTWGAAGEGLSIEHGWQLPPPATPLAPPMFKRLRHNHRKSFKARW